MGLQEAPTSFTRDKVRLKPPVSSKPPTMFFWVFNPETEKRSKTNQSSPGYRDGASPPCTMACFPNHLYWAHRMLKRPRKKTAYF